MRRYAIVLTGAIVSCLTLASAALAEDYSKMAPFDQYMTDRSVEIALAKSAAPPAIADKASVMVLTRKGYETAIKGSNGFVCAVERSWMAQFDFPQFWNPHMRGRVVAQRPAHMRIPELRKIELRHPRALHRADEAVAALDRGFVALAREHHHACLVCDRGRCRALRQRDLDAAVRHILIEGRHFGIIFGERGRCQRQAGHYSARQNNRVPPHGSLPVQGAGTVRILLAFRKSHLCDGAWATVA